MTFKDYVTELSNPEINNLEKYLDRIFAELDVVGDTDQGIGFYRQYGVAGAPVQVDIIFA